MGIRMLFSTLTRAERKVALVHCERLSEMSEREPHLGKMG